MTVNAIFITGTAGSGKSLLTSRLLHWYRESKAYPIALNLDAGAVSLPYDPVVDVRNYIDIATLMENYGLGPNGSLVMARDMIATKRAYTSRPSNSQSEAHHGLRPLAHGARTRP